MTGGKIEKLKEYQMRALFQIIFYILISIYACAIFAKADAMDISLLEGRWVLETVNGKRIAGEQDIYFEIKGQTITGYDGCNRFGGSLSEPSLLRKSQRACSTDESQFPLDLSNPLAQLSAATLKDSQLILLLPGGKGEATFKRG